MFRLLRAASSLYSRRPVACNMAMYGVLYSSAEISQQTIRKKRKYDWDSAGRMATMGATFYGPFYYYWYRFLDAMLPGRRYITILKKVALDQSVAGVIGLSVFFTCKLVTIIIFIFIPLSYNIMCLGCRSWCS